MRPRAALLLGLLLAASPACQSQTAPPPAVTVEADPGAEAGAALAAGRYAEAVALYRRALEQAPARVPLRYGLAVALSYSDRGAAIREFQWVLANAEAGSLEANESRAWLARAGALPRNDVERATAADRELQPGNAVLSGRALFAEKGERPGPMRRMQLFLVGQPDSPTKEERYNLRTGEDGSFTFPNVVPGPYMLTNRIAGQPTWRLRVELKPSEEKQLELGPGNSLAAQDDFPQHR
jgi:tetratricopeptide (TPR) repeat protein